MAELGAGDALLTFTRSGIGGDSAYLAKLLPIYYRKAILENILKAAGMWQKCEVEAFPLRTGKTATLFRYPNLVPITTALVEGENPTPTQIPTAQFTVDLAILGGWVPPTEFGQMVTIDGLRKLPEIVREWADSSMELYLAKNLTPFMKKVRVDKDSTYERDFVTTSAGATTTVISTDLAADANDIFNGGLVTCVDDTAKNYGLSRYVTDFVTSTGTITCAAFPVASEDAKRYHISDTQGIVSTDVMSLAGTRAAIRQLRANGAYGPKFEIAGGGYWQIYDGIQEEELGADSDIKNLFITKEKETGIRTYVPGTISMLHPVLTFYPFRSVPDTGTSTYDATGGAVHSAIFGKNAIKRLPLGKKDVQIIHKSKESGGTSNPLEMYSTLGWKITMAVVNTDTNASVALITGR